MKNKFTDIASNLYAEFKKHPTYYISSFAFRIAIGGAVGYGMYLGLNALAASYLIQTPVAAVAPVAIANLVPNTFQQMFPMIPNLPNLPNLPAIADIPSMMPNSVSYLTSLLPTVISTISGLGALLAATKLSNLLLTAFFGEIEIKANINNETPEKPIIESVTFSAAILRLFGQNRPYITPVSEIATQLEKTLKTKNKDNAELLPQSRTLALAYTKQLVESNETLYQFNDEARAQVNSAPYVTPTIKSQ